jgi:hypothetical protein
MKFTLCGQVLLTRSLSVLFVAARMQKSAKFARPLANFDFNAIFSFSIFHYDDDEDAGCVIIIEKIKINISLLLWPRHR